VSTDISDCIAMAEDGHTWFAFPKTMTRGQVMASLARSAEDLHVYSWPEVLKFYRVVTGYVQEEPPGSGWWRECWPNGDAAVPCWIVRMRQSGGTTCA
jgi:hypothetical protein